MRTYAKTKCHTCGEYTSSAGAARAAHNKKHVREGLLVPLYSRILDRTEYFPPAKAKAYLDGTVINYANWFQVAG